VVEAVAGVAVEEVEDGVVADVVVAVVGEVAVGEEGLEEGEARISTCRYWESIDLRIAT
jgi:hypothetical protein